MPTAPAYQQYRLIHDIYVLLDDGDRRVLNTCNLTTSQYAVLRLLNLEKGRRLTSLSDQLLCARSTITRIVDQLEDTGLVLRVNDPEDRRAQLAVLTQKGATMLDSARATHCASVTSRMDNLTEGEQEQLILLLGKLRNGLRAQLDSNAIPDEAGC
jgi:MarR family 2-MHQ and catechol resistance regulon transcriptional repressor